MTVSVILSFDLGAFWHIGTGQGESAHVDAAVARDVDGLPVLHGRAIKGLLREALTAAEELGQVPAGVAAWLCGTPARQPADDTTGLRRHRFESHPGHATFTNAVLPESWRAFATGDRQGNRIATLFDVVQATAIDEETGQAKDHSLRAVEVAVPMTLTAEVTLEPGAAPPPWTVPGTETPIDWVAALERALPLLRGLGAHRNRGLGRVRVTLTRAARTTPAADRTPVPTGDGQGATYLRVELLGDLILSVDGGTAGQHESLDQIPGAVFLGAVARHYRWFADHGEAWRVFHDGTVRFGPAYPLVGDEPAVPVPLSWHTPKYQQDAYPDLDAERDRVVCDRARTDRAPEGIQWKQLRSGFVTPTGRHVTVRKGFRRMTAIDRSRRGHARTGMLFGYQTLVAGQTFWLRLDAPVPPAVFAKIVESLTDRPIRIGRSLSAEYGKVRLTAWAGASDQALACRPVADAGPVLVYLLSDAAFVDPDTGAASLAPTPTQIGLPTAGWALDRAHSFLRSRRYAPYNSQRAAFDPDRIVLVKGSVLCYARTSPDVRLSEADRASLDRAMADGVGLYRQDGLGRILVNPWLLDRPERRLTRSESDPPGVAAAWPTDTLGAFARRRFADRELPAVAHRLAHDYETYLMTVRETIAEDARLAGRPVASVVPSKAQWGALRTRVDETPIDARLAELDRRLFDPRDGLLTSGVGRRVWASASPFDPRQGEMGETSSADLVRDLINETRLIAELRAVGLHPPPPAPVEPELVSTLARLALSALAQRMPRAIAGQEGQQEETV